MKFVLVTSYVCILVTSYKHHIYDLGLVSESLRLGLFLDGGVQGQPERGHLRTTQHTPDLFLEEDRDRPASDVQAHSLFR